MAAGQEASPRLLGGHSQPSNIQQHLHALQRLLRVCLSFLLLGLRSASCSKNKGLMIREGQESLVVLERRHQQALCLAK